MSKKNFISYGDAETLFSQIAYKFAHLITGHRIKDKSGNAMTARDVLKVDGYLETTDDSTNAQTVISDAPTDVTWAQYLAKSASEKQGKKWLIHDVPGICAKINAEMLSLLWENPNPTSAISETDVTISDATDYDIFLVLYKIKNSYSTIFTSIAKKDSFIGLAFLTRTSSNLIAYIRYVNIVDATTAHIGNASYDVQGSSSSTVDNNYMIPLAIYGLKTTLDGTMFMMAEDLATSADKCMLSDGETSVETKIGAMETNFQDGVDDIYDAVVAKGSTPASHSLSDVVTGIGNIPTGITPSGTKSITANGTDIDVTQYAAVDVAVPNTNSDTYTFAANDKGATKDLGVSNTYRYVNAANVYTKGVTDGRSLTSQTKTISVSASGVEGTISSGSATFTFGTKIVGITAISLTTSGYYNIARFKSVSISGKTVTIRMEGCTTGWSYTYSFSVTAVGY